MKQLTDEQRNEVEHIVRETLRKHDWNFVQSLFEQYVSDNEAAKRAIEEMQKTLEQILRVTADGSIPDEWNGSTGGSGHNECRKLARQTLQSLKEVQEKP